MISAIISLVIFVLQALFALYALNKINVSTDGKLAEGFKKLIELLKQGYGGKL